MRLLLVEDDPMIGESLVKGLRDDGYTVDWVRDGTAGLAALLDRRADFSIAILDWDLPRLDGLSVLRGVRAEGNQLPILMMTARDCLSDQITALEGGADDFLRKPFELAELKAQLRSLLHHREGHRSSDLTSSSR